MAAHHLSDPFSTDDSNPWAGDSPPLQFSQKNNLTRQPFPPTATTETETDPYAITLPLSPTRSLSAISDTDLDSSNPPPPLVKEEELAHEPDAMSAQHVDDLPPTSVPPSTEFNSFHGNDDEIDDDEFGEFGDFDSGGVGSGDFGDFTADSFSDFRAPIHEDTMPRTPDTSHPFTSSTVSDTPSEPMPSILVDLMSGTFPVTGVFDLQNYIASKIDKPESTPAVPYPHLHVTVSALSTSNSSDLGDIPTPSASLPSSPQSVPGKRIVMNPVFAKFEYYQDITRLAEIPLFDENISTRIRWRRCLVRKLMLSALDVHVVWDDDSEMQGGRVDGGQVKPGRGDLGGSPPSQRKTPLPTSNQPVPSIPEQPKSAATPAIPATLTADDLSKLAHLPEDELRTKTDAELAEIIVLLNAAIPSLHAQINHYLDAKEQLALDAEMHNKLISVLVQQAQKSHGQLKNKLSNSKRK